MYVLRFKRKEKKNCEKHMKKKNRNKRRKKERKKEKEIVLPFCSKVEFSFKSEF